MEIEWKESAHLSLSLTLKYVSRKFSDRVAKQMSKKIFEKVSLLRDDPLLGKVVPSNVFGGRIRYLVVRKRSKIFYVLGEDKIYIILIWDTRKDPAILNDLFSILLKSS